MRNLIMSMIRRVKGKSMESSMSNESTPIYDQMEREYFEKHGVSIMN